MCADSQSRHWPGLKNDSESRHAERIIDSRVGPSGAAGLASALAPAWIPAASGCGMTGFFCPFLQDSLVPVSKRRRRAESKPPAADAADRLPGSARRHTGSVAAKIAAGGYRLKGSSIPILAPRSSLSLWLASVYHTEVLRRTVGITSPLQPNCTAFRVSACGKALLIR